MRFARELGYGGNGVAALFYTSNISPPYNRKDFVVKVNHIDARHTRQAFLYEKATTGVSLSSIRCHATEMSTPTDNDNRCSQTQCTWFSSRTSPL